MMYQMRKPLVLASNSPRRRDFLTDLGLDFEVFAEEIDERVLADEKPLAYVERMAREKAEAVQEHFPDKFILAADTAVCLENVILGKPADEGEARAMLEDLSGRVHQVRTGICVSCLTERVERVASVTTQVRFAPLDKETVRGYVEEGESLDKAGGYGIQGKGAVLVERINGSYTNVVGLPLCEVVALLVHHRVISTAGPSAGSSRQP